MRLTAASLGLAALGVLAACDIPTGAPNYTTEWNVPAKNTTISVNTFLPSGVSATTDNSAFQVTISPSSSTITRSLGQDCASCAAANGQTSAKPAFAGGGTTSMTLPTGVSTATLVRDTLSVTIANGFNFDPIRPSAAGARGSLVITVANGGTIVGKDSLDGAAIAIPANGTVTRKIALNGTVTAASGLQISTSLISPVGDPVAINSALAITVTGATGPFFISSAKVNLNNQQVTSSATSLDLSSIDHTITDHLDAGQLLLTVNNPFTATGNLTVTLSGGPQLITKTLALTAGASTPVISLTASEVKSLFGSNISLTFAGGVSGTGVTVSPGQTVTVAARMQLGVNVGSK
jgi:hypothetical protein